MSEIPGRYHYSAVMMGTRVELQLAAHQPALARQVFRQIKWLEDLLTVNRPDSALMSVNRGAGAHPVVVPPPVFSLLWRAREVSFSGGCFNLAIGPLVRRWKIGFSGDAVPPAEEIAALLPLTDPHAIRMDPEAGSIFLTRPGMSVDAGAIAKGYMADRICDFLQAQAVDHALINLGGNIRVISPPGAEGWSVGLQQPFAGPESLLGSIRLSQGSVVTSGVYERYFVHQGHHYHHILDPRSGYPLDNDLLSVTVISPHSIDGEIYSTQLYGMGLEKGCEWLAAHAGAEGIEAIFVTRDREVIIPSQRQFCFRPASR